MNRNEAEYQALRKYVKLLGSAGEWTLSARMGEALERELTPRQRQLIELYYVEQHTMMDISAMLGLNVSTISRTLKRARKALKHSLRYGGRSLLSSLEE